MKFSIKDYFIFLCSVNYDILIELLRFCYWWWWRLLWRHSDNYHDNGDVDVDVDDDDDNDDDGHHNHYHHSS